MMWPDQWLAKKLAQVLHWRYGAVLGGESHKWAAGAEAQRVARLKAALAACGEDVTIRPGAHILVPSRVQLGHHVALGHYTMLNGNGGIHLGDFVLLGDHVVLASSTHPVEAVRFHTTEEAPIRVEDNAWLGAGAIVLPGVTIGANAVVAAGAVVTADVPANTVVGGVPARPLRTFELSSQEAQRQKRAIRAKRIVRMGLDSEIDDIFSAED